MRSLFLFLGLTLIAAPLTAQADFEKDVIEADGGDLRITFVGHGSLIFEFEERVIHVDPYGRLADYSTLPKADVIFVTHHHGDHLDVGAIDAIKTDETVIVLTERCAEEVSGGIVMRNGETRVVDGIGVEAVPAYNIVHMRNDGTPFHPKGVGNGYVLTMGGLRVYVAGDTENTPEMKALKSIDIAFLPMNLPYTMTPEMVADAAAAFKPGILYPYHFGETETDRLVKLLKDEKTIDVRVRNME
jgi:L-ascorbate metabolism protein UlaG (beta-lactamase superfamily)